MAGTKYKVVRNNKPECPCGMNAIRYLGDNERKARALFNRLPVGLDDWDKPNPDYGLVLAKWDEESRWYKVLATRGLQHAE